MVLEFAIADGGLTGVALRRHRGPHNIHGKGQCRRLVKLVPSLIQDTGTTALLYFRFVEWLAAPILFPNATVQDKPVYQYLVGIERMGAALDCAIAKLKGDAPRAPAVLRAQLRRAVEKDRYERGDEATEYVVADADLYEVATAFPNVADYKWLSLVRFQDLLCAAGSLAV